MHLVCLGTRGKRVDSSVWCGNVLKIVSRYVSCLYYQFLGVRRVSDEHRISKLLIVFCMCRDGVAKAHLIFQ